LSIDFILLVAAQAAGGEAASGGLPQLDMSNWPGQLFWLFVFFGLLYALMTAYFLPRIGAAIEERRDRIADDLDQAAEQRKKAEAAEKAYDRALADASAKAQAIAGETRAKLNAEIAQLAADADRISTKALADAEARIAEMRADASKKVKEAAIDAARTIVSTLIDETPTAETAAAAARERAIA